MRFLYFQDPVISLRSVYIGKVLVNRSDCIFLCVEFVWGIKVAEIGNFEAQFSTLNGEGNLPILTFFYLCLIFYC